MKLKTSCVVVSFVFVCSTFNAMACDEQSSPNWLEELIGHTLPVDLPDVPNHDNSQPDCTSGPKQPDPDTDDPEG